MMVWWEPVWLESNFEVCSPFPCQLLHLVQLLLLLDGQVDLLERVDIQVEQVQLSLLKKDKESNFRRHTVWKYQAVVKL